MRFVFSQQFTIFMGHITDAKHKRTFIAIYATYIPMSKATIRFIETTQITFDQSCVCVCKLYAICFLLSHRK